MHISVISAMLLQTRSMRQGAIGSGSPPPPPPPSGGGDITINLVLNRTSGPAPLAIWACASDMTGAPPETDTFRLVCAWSFGDTNPGTWAISGESKNQQIGGPIAGHIYETPGVYTLAVALPDGSFATQEITVLDPNTHWPGSATVFVSPTGNYAGAPAGAELRTTLPSTYSGKRVLLRRGESGSFGSVNIPDNSTNFLVRDFGEGSAPNVSSVGIGSFAGKTQAIFPTFGAVCNLNVANGIEHACTGHNLLIMGNTLTAPGASASNRIGIGGALPYFVDNFLTPSDYYWPRHIFVVENTISGSTESDATPQINIEGSYVKSCVMGNDVQRADQHTMRLYFTHQTFIGHNWLRGGSSSNIRHTLKLHSDGLNSYNDNIGVSGMQVATRQVVIANNRFSADTNNHQWVLVVAPQNGSSVEGIEDVIVENNGFVNSPGSLDDIRLHGRRMTTRGNTRYSGGGAMRYTTSQTGYYTGMTASAPGWNGPYYTS